MRRKRTGTNRPWDLIYAQFANPGDVPFSLVTRQFHDKLSSLLSAEGAYIVSVADTTDEGRFLGAVIGTLGLTFPNVQVVARKADHPAGISSFVVVAGHRQLDLAAMLNSYAASPPARVLDAVQIERIKGRASGLVLTDDRVPTETLFDLGCAGGRLVAACFGKQLPTGRSAGEPGAGQPKRRSLPTGCLLGYPCSNRCLYRYRPAASQHGRA